LLNIDYQFLSG